MRSAGIRSPRRSGGRATDRGPAGTRRRAAPPARSPAAPSAASGPRPTRCAGAGDRGEPLLREGREQAETEIGLGDVDAGRHEAEVRRRRVRRIQLTHRRRGEQDAHRVSLTTGAQIEGGCPWSPRSFRNQDGLVVVDKPWGLPSTGAISRTLVRSGMAPTHARSRKVWAVHQLDQDTSGLNMFVLKKPLVPEVERTARGGSQDVPRHRPRAGADHDGRRADRDPPRGTEDLSGDAIGRRSGDHRGRGARRDGRGLARRRPSAHGTNPSGAAPSRARRPSPVR